MKISVQLRNVRTVHEFDDAGGLKSSAKVPGGWRVVAKPETPEESGKSASITLPDGQSVSVLCGAPAAWFDAKPMAPGAAASAEVERARASEAAARKEADTALADAREARSTADQHAIEARDARAHIVKLEGEIAALKAPKS